MVRRSLSSGPIHRVLALPSSSRAGFVRHQPHFVGASATLREDDGGTRGLEFRASCALGATTSTLRRQSRNLARPPNVLGAGRTSARHMWHDQFGVRGSRNIDVAGQVRRDGREPTRVLQRAARSAFGSHRSDQFTLRPRRARASTRRNGHACTNVVFRQA